ncbi:MAG: SCP2 sterol-binding domain-containing protein [Gemmatimonadetes bacterium]|nr:SCP2 sterol-binding domain-containing protein [Gemmatimonadota bacterium]
MKTFHVDDRLIGVLSSRHYRVHSVTTPPFTQSWADAFRDAVNRDVPYRQAGIGWTATVALVLDDGAPVGLIGPVALEVTLDRGLCNNARIISPDACVATFVFRGDYDAWMEVMGGAMDPVAAVMRGQIRLTGDVATLMTHGPALTALVRCAQSVTRDVSDQPAA